MEDKFMESLKSFSVQDMLEDQRPSTSRLMTARGSRQPSGPSTFAGANNGFLGGSSMPKSNSAFVEEFRPGTTKPKAGRVRSSWGARPGSKMGNSLRPGTSKSKTGSVKSSDEIVDFIPDLSEMAEDEFAMSIALAPRVEAQRITSLTQLDAEMSSRQAFSKVRNVDLRKLTKFMMPEKSLIENSFIRPPGGNLPYESPESLKTLVKYVQDAFLTEISTLYEEKLGERGSSATSPWSDEEDED